MLPPSVLSFLMRLSQNEERKKERTKERSPKQGVDLQGFISSNGFDVKPSGWSASHPLLVQPAVGHDHRAGVVAPIRGGLEKLASTYIDCS